MGVDKNGNNQKPQMDGKVVPSQNQPVDMIASKLRSFYDSVTDEGTPDYLLTLLDRLDAAEKAAASKPDLGSED